MDLEKAHAMDRNITRNLSTLQEIGLRIDGVPGYLHMGRVAQKCQSDETWERGIDEEGVEDHSSQAQVFCFLPPQIDPTVPMDGRRMGSQSPPGISFLVRLYLTSGIG